MYKLIEDTVKDTNSRCPILIDQTIRIDSCEIVSDNTIKYNYTFLFIDATRIDKEAFKNQIWEYIIYHIQNDKSIAKLRAANTTFIYSCRDENENILDDLRVTPDNYNTIIERPVSIDPEAIDENMLHDILQQIVDQTQRQLPLFTEDTGISMVDCRTYDKTLEYTCKLLNEEVGRFDAIYFKTTGVPAAIESLKNNPEMKTFARQGVYISNVYLDKDAKYLCTITISPEEYL